MKVEGCRSQQNNERRVSLVVNLETVVQAYRYLLLYSSNDNINIYVIVLGDIEVNIRGDIAWLDRWIYPLHTPVSHTWLVVLQAGVGGRPWRDLPGHVYKQDKDSPLQCLRWLAGCNPGNRTRYRGLLQGLTGEH